jgi:hypothetical protein
MDNKTRITIIMLRIVAYVAVFAVGWIMGVQSVENRQPAGSLSDINGGDLSTVQVTLEAEEVLLTFSDAELAQSDSVFDVLKRLHDREEINLEYTDYGSELGVFINSINGTGSSSESKWWQYWVNGDYQNVGVSSYFPVEGDDIVFKFTDEYPE